MTLSAEDTLEHVQDILDETFDYLQFDPPFETAEDLAVYLSKILDAIENTIRR